MARRLSGEGSVYRRRSDGRYVAAVSLGRWPDGRRRRKVIYGETAREVLEARAEVLAQYAATGTTRRQPGTVAAYLVTWMDVTLPSRVAAGDLAQSTRDQYADKMSRYVVPTTLGKQKLKLVEPADVREWLGWLSTRRTSRGRTMTPGGVRLVYRVLRAALQDAVDDGLLVRSPATTVKPPKAQPYRGDPLTVDEARRVLSVDNRWHALWVVFTYLGLRHGEALELRWPDVDFDSKTILIRGTKTRESWATLPLPSPVAHSLTQHRATQRRQIMRASVWADPGLVFTTRVGTRLNPSNVRKEWRSVCAQAAVPPHRIHDLRHTTATLLLEAGVPVEAVARILRHRSATVTRDVYVHILEGAQAAATDALANLLEGR